MTMPTFADATFVRQSDLNLLSTAIVNQSVLLNGVPPPRGYVPTGTAKLTSTKSVPNRLDTVITFDAAGVNNDGIWVAAIDHFTIQTGGMYTAWAQACFAANGTGTRSVSILLNGTTVASNSVGMAIQTRPSSSDVATLNAETPPMYLAPGATLYFNAWQSSGGSLNLTTGLSGTFLAVLRLGN